MSFSSVNTALSALRYNSVAMDVASQNIANSDTEGYTRRRVESSTAGVPTRPAMWSRNQSPAGGVKIDGVSRMTDAFLDARVRTEHGKQSYLDTRLAVLDRLETGIGEPGDNGLSTVMTELRSAWSDLANTPDRDAGRSGVLASAASLADAFAIQARNFDVEASDQRVKINAMVAEVNTLVADLAVSNKAIHTASLDGADAGGLMDQRDLIALRLSELTGGTATLGTGGGIDFKINGVALVTGSHAGKLEITSGVTPDGAADGNRISFQITHPLDGTTAVPGRLSGGEIGAVSDLLDDTIPSYKAGLDAVAKQLADAVNSTHQSGYDAAGNPGEPFFTYDPSNPASSLSVRITDPAKVAASSLPGGVIHGGTAHTLSQLTGPESSYQQLVNGFGITVASAKRVSASQQMLTQQVDGARDQLAGVSLDEELLSMVQYQRGYEAAARVLTTVDSMLDTLINRTGLLR